MNIVPKIRFKNYIGDWKKNKIKNIATVNPSTDLPNNFNYIDLESVSGIEIINFRKETKENAPSRARRLANRGDIFYQTVRPYQKNNALFDFSDDNYVFSTGYAQVRVKEKINNYFLFTKFQEQNFVNNVLRRSTGTSYPAINSTDFKNISIFFPNLDEQIKIGILFKKLDEAILLQQQVLDTTKEYKKSMLQKMFPKKRQLIPEVRFKEFKNNWKYKKIHDVAEVVSGGTPNTQNSSYWSGNINWFSPSEINNKRFVSNSIKKITQKGLNKSSAKLLPPHKTILFTSRATIGLMAILDREATTNQGFQSFIVRENTDVYFLFSMKNQIKREALRLANGSTFLEISNKEVKKISILIPSYKEQIKIGNFFKTLDKRIEKEQQKLNTYKKIKQAFLQKMFF